MGIGRMNGGVRNPLYEHKKETPRPDRNAEPRSKTRQLDKVKVRRAFGGELSRQTRDAVAQALWEDVPKAFDVPKEKKNAVAKLVASMLSVGLNRSLMDVYGVVTETPRDRLRLRKNRKLGVLGRFDREPDVAREIRERNSLNRLVSNIQDADELKALKGVLHDRDKRKQVMIDAACLDLGMVAYGGVEPRAAMIGGLQMAFPKLTPEEREAKVNEVMAKVPPPFYAEAFRELLERDWILEAAVSFFYPDEVRGDPQVVKPVIVEEVFRELNRQIVVLQGKGIELETVESEDAGNDTMTKAHRRILEKEVLSKMSVRKKISQRVREQLDVPETLRGLVADSAAKGGPLKKGVLQRVLLKELERFRPSDKIEQLNEAEKTLQEAFPTRFGEDRPVAWEEVTPRDLPRVLEVFEKKWGPPLPPRPPAPPAFMEDAATRRMR